jgi:hypothetical protein
MALTPRDRPHFHVEGGGQGEAYTSPRLIITGMPPARVRAAHAARLGLAIGTALAAGRQRIAEREEGLAEGDASVSATVFVPEAPADFFARKIEAYRDEETKKAPPKIRPWRPGSRIFESVRPGRCSPTMARPFLSLVGQPGGRFGCVTAGCPCSKRSRPG